MINLKNHVSLLNYALFQMDMVLFLFACTCVYGSILPDHPLSIWSIIYLLAATHTSFFVADLYNVEEVLKEKESFKKYAGAYAIFLALITIASLFNRNSSVFGSEKILLLLFYSATFLLSWRFAFTGILSSIFPSQNILILGTGKHAQIIWKELQKRREKKWNIVGFVEENKTLRSSPFDRGKKTLGDDLYKFIVEKNISSVVVALDQLRGKMPTEELLDSKVKQGVDIFDFTTFYEKITGKIWVENLRPSWLIFSSGFSNGVFYKGIKRLCDIVFSVAFLVIFSPVFIITGILIKLTSDGPALFSQERVGLHGKEFTLYKFRTMGKDAEKETGPVWAGEDDPRITKVGKLLRKWRIDEIPQIYNVLNGDMSFIGPRPERKFFIDQLVQTVPFYTMRHVVKPGVSGWAAVKFRYGSTSEDAKEKLKYDLYYIKNASLFLDFIILLKTINVVLYGKGSR